MTEQEWLTSEDLSAMRDAICGEVSDRKLRLFACACVRQIWHRLEDDRSRKAVETAERFADGAATENERQVDWDAAWDAAWTPAWTTAGLAAWAAARAAARAEAWEVAWEVARAAARAAARPAVKATTCPAQAHLLRDIMGNPFCPATFAMPPHAAFRSDLWGFAYGIAKEAYTDRNPITGHLSPVRLAILADALEEAGCNATTLLEHLRSPSTHIRGCWALDLVLGKE